VHWQAAYLRLGEQAPLLLLPQQVCLLLLQVPEERGWMVMQAL